MINPRYTLDHGNRGLFGWFIVAMALVLTLLYFVVNQEEATNRSINQCTEDNGIAIVGYTNDGSKALVCINQNAVLWGEK